ncbi:MAG: hypothetical protein IK142_00595, partial [Clostridiales bacterium]|nr:hypothetical protein [Clostridiales bacterium]
MEELIKQLKLGPEFEEGLGGLKVEKIDYYRNTNTITIRLSGDAPAGSDKLLDIVREAMEMKSGSKVGFEYEKEAQEAPVAPAAADAPAPRKRVSHIDPELK